MLKILYAAQNNSNAAIQLARFMQAVQDKPVQVKVAAFKKSSPRNMHIDWTLDALLDIRRPDIITTSSNTFNIYYDQISYYSPDLVISDLEYFTSYIATNLNIQLWQCSSSLLDLALKYGEKRDSNLFAQYRYLLQKDNALRTGRMLNIIESSNLNFVYSHLGDIDSPPAIHDKYKWIRPYHTIGKVSRPCQHNIVACSPNDRKMIDLLKKKGDCIVFTNNTLEQQPGIWMKDISNAEEYYCNLKNCNLFVCGGQTSFLADAFYNGKYAATMVNFHDLECVMNGMFSAHLKLSSMIYTVGDIEQHLDKSVESGYNSNVRYLHNYIDDII